jgi:hypothetical protein
MTIAKSEELGIRSSFLSKNYKKLSALQGLSEGDAEKLKTALNVKTIRDLAELKYVKWAQAIVTLAEYEN